MSQKYYFHAGKGGVGKSTTSSLTALHLAARGKKVLLISLDPAHNQQDIFDMPIGDKPQVMAPGLEVAQADVDVWIAEYLKGVENQMKRTYTYQTAFNLEKKMGIIKHSPGIEEYGLLLAFKHYKDKHPDVDVIVCDMPPTALTTKFFHLPALSMLWVDELLKLRREIMDKREIITKIHFGKKVIERDKVTCRLDQQRGFFGDLQTLFCDQEASSIRVVVNPDKLSFAEAERMEKQLAGMGIGFGGVIMNKVLPDSTWDASGPLFKKGQVHPLPLSPLPLIGLPALRAYLDEHSADLDFLE